MKRYEVSYANQVLATLAARETDGVVEASVRQLAEECGVSASAVQIGLSALRRAGRVKTRRRGSAGRPSVIEIVDSAPVGEPQAVGAGNAAAGGPLASALIERYERLLLEVDRVRSRPEELAAENQRLRERIAELEAENSDLRAKHVRR